MSNKNKRQNLYDRIKPTIERVFKSAADGRYLQYHVIGKSVEGRDMHFVVLAQNKESVNNYLEYTLPQMLDNPAELQKKIKADGARGIKVPIFFNNMHPDEPPAVEAILTLMRLLATRKSLSYRPSNNEKRITINVDEALENIIFLFNFTANPDGLYHNKRKNMNGFDLNRDNAYQTQPETKALIRQIVKWNPIDFLDFHGYIKSFLIEPSSPPHDPNYEYDLLMDGMIEQAKSMGNAVTANTKYKSFRIPLLDSNYGWDDASPRDLSSYVLLHGIMGHTIEIPEDSREAYNALIYTALAAIKYVMDNKYRLFNNQLECFRRGIEGIDDRAVDKYLINPEGEQVGRPRGKYKNFFPEYYVIPVEKNMQKNPLEAYNAVKYLLANGVKVYKTTRNVIVGNVNYPKDTYIVPMRQAKRGYVNAVFYKGMDLSHYKKMHAIITMNFPDLRGFDTFEVRSSGVFDGAVERVASVKIPSTHVSVNSNKVIIKNSNNHAVKAVNRLLSDNRPVKMLLQNGSGYRMGDYLVSTEDFESVKKLYFLDVVPYDGNLLTRDLSMPKVANTGTKQTAFVLKELGFKLVDNVEDYNIIVDDYGGASKEYIVQGKHYIGIGGYSLKFIKEANLLEEFDYGRTSFRHEGLLRCQISQDSLITSGYNKEELLYFANGSWIEKVPPHAEIFARAMSGDFFVSGWWPGHEKVGGKILGFSCTIGESKITLFASDLTKNAHPQHSFRLLANAIFASV